MSRSVCPSCAKELEAGLRFCVGCGLSTSQMPLLPRCSKCDAIAREGDKFCTLCRGAILMPATPDAASAFCTECGQKLGADDRFCPGCGKPQTGRQSSVAAMAPQTPAQIVAPKIEPVPPTPPQVPKAAAAAAPVVHRSRRTFAEIESEAQAARSASPPPVAPPKPPVVESHKAPVAETAKPRVEPPKLPVAEKAVHPTTAPASDVPATRAESPAREARKQAQVVPPDQPKRSRAWVGVVAAAAAIALVAGVIWSMGDGDPAIGDGSIAVSGESSGSGASGTRVSAGEIQRPTPPAPQLTAQLRQGILASTPLTVELDPVDPTVKAFEPTGKMELLSSSALADGWQELQVKCEVIRRHLNRERKEYPVMQVRVGPGGAIASVQPIGVKDEQWDLLLK